MARLKILDKSILFLTLFLVSNYAQAADTLGIAVPENLWYVDPLATRDPTTQLFLGAVSMPLRDEENSNEPGQAILEGVATDAHRDLVTIRTKKKLYLEKGRELTGSIVEKSVRFLQGRANYLRNLSQSTPLPHLLRIGLRSPALHPKQEAALMLHGVPLELLETLQSLRDIKAGNPLDPKERYICTFILPKGNSADLQALLALPLLDGEVAPQMGADFAFGTNHPYFGPFIAQENRPDSGVYLRSRKDYYRAGYPRIETLEIRNFPQPQDALNALRTAAIDIIPFPTQTQLAAVENDPTLAVIPAPRVLSDPRMKLRSPYWGEEKRAENRIVLSQSIVRRSVQVDDEFKNSLALDGVSFSVTY